MMRFQLAGGSVQGANHRRAGRNNQDAFHVNEDESGVIALVADGCGSSLRAEVGAHLGLPLLAAAIRRQLESGASDKAPDIEQILELSRQDVLAQLRTLALEMETGVARTVFDYFLFTIVGIVTTREQAWIFSLGDGVYAINGQVSIIGPFDQNQPPYLGYGLLESMDLMPEASTFTVHQTIDVQQLESFALGTDGVTDLIRSETSALPGKDELVGPINQFWVQDKFFANPEAINRRLRLINQEAYIFDPLTQSLVRHDRGLLPDDTTLMVGRVLLE